MKSIQLLGVTLLASTTLLGAGQAFADVSQPSTPDPKQATTPITAELTVKETPNEKPQTPGGAEGGDDVETGVTGLFGIAYAPGELTVNAELSSDKAEQRVALKSKKDANVTKHNVGVQDKTRAKDRNWTLSAQLSWKNDANGYMAGTSIATSAGQVALNEGGTLNALTDGEVTAKADTLLIGQDAPAEVMSATKGKTVNGVYNYQFTSPELVIPHPEEVATGSYSGEIVWNLSDVVM